MKTIVLLLILLALPVAAQKKKEVKKEEPKNELVKKISKEEMKAIQAKLDESSQDWKWVNKYVLEPKIKEMKKALPRVQQKVDLYKAKVNQAKTEAAKKRYQALLTKEETNLEKAKLWEYYQQYYIKAKVSLIKHDDAELVKCAKSLKLIKNRYKTLTAEKFPDPERTFYQSPEGKKLLDMRKKKEEARKKAEAGKNKSNTTSSKK